MLKFFIGFIFGIFSVIIFSVLKMSSKCSREEENKKKCLNYGQDAYNELEKLEKENNKK